VPNTVDAVGIDKGQAFGQDASKNAIELANEKGAAANALCFLPTECTEAGGTLTPDIRDCGVDRGKCIAPEPTIRLSTPVLGRVTVTGIRDFVSLALKYLLNAGMIAAVIMFVYAGFQYILSASVFQIGAAKETMGNAIIGLLILFGAVTILTAINPSLTAYPRTTVYMINKIIFEQAEWCKDFKKPAGQGATTYAYTGDPAGSIKYDAAKFDTELKNTECGKKYYPQQYGGQFCSGQKCQEKGFACVSCKGNFDECGGNPMGVACVKAAFAGNISWSQYSSPQKIYLIGVCGGAAAGGSFEELDKNIPEYVQGRIVKAGSEERGSTGYLFTTEPGDYQKARNACGGDFRGFILGVQYKDSCDSFKAVMSKINAASKGAKTGGEVGSTIGSGVGVAGGTVLTAGIATVPAGIMGAVGGGIGGAAVGSAAGVATEQIKCATNANDVLIVTKRDCASGGARYYSGYADGKGSQSDFADMKKAMYCGWRKLPGIAPGLQPVSKNTRVFDSNPDTSLNPYWTFEEIQAAATGESEAIACDLALNFENAAPDPETNYYGSCE